LEFRRRILSRSRRTQRHGVVKDEEKEDEMEKKTGENRSCQSFTVK
jgi:hypothetical protein